MNRLLPAMRSVASLFVHLDPAEEKPSFRWYLIWFRTRLLSWTTCFVFCWLGYKVLDTQTVVFPAVPHDVQRDIGIALLVAGFVGIGLDFIALGAGRARTEVIAEERARGLHKASKFITAQHNPGDYMMGLADVLYAGPDFHRFREAMRETVAQVENIKALRGTESTSREGRDLAEFMDFLAWSLIQNVSNVAKEKSKSLAVLSKRRGSDDSTYRIPDRFEFNRRLLGSQMRTLGRTHTYDSLANWRLYDEVDTKDFYETTTGEAIIRGAKIRRIFNLCAVADKHLNRVQKVIERQQELVSPEKFELKFLSCEDLKGISSTDPVARAARAINAPGAQETVNLNTTFFGVFKRGDEVVLYYTEQSQERKIVESVGVYEAEGAPPQEDYLVLFDLLWKIASTQNPLPERIQRLNENPQSSPAQLRRSKPRKSRQRGGRGQPASTRAPQAPIDGVLQGSAAAPLPDGAQGTEGAAGRVSSPDDAS
ncbi:hypothetical protein PQR75_21815 [Paraburkholderia fungorum]|uniref:hypothetical protein n=1 Tax=Paraburkholderia fungorum TaxID=134537 RepID=UPI0038B7BA2C